MEKGQMTSPFRYSDMQASQLIVRQTLIIIHQKLVYTISLIIKVIQKCIHHPYSVGRKYETNQLNGCKHL